MLVKFDYARCDSINDLLDVLSNSGKNIGLIAGGTDLLVQIRSKLVKPDAVISIKDIPELTEIKETAHDITVGAAVSFSEIIGSSVIHDNFPVLQDASGYIGSPIIRNLATIGGNVQTASPAADGLAALYSLDAQVVLVSPRGERLLKIEDFVIGPKKTARAKDELIKAFRIPKIKWDMEKFFKVGKRNALAISIVNGVVRAAFEDGRKIKEARVVLGAVAPTPLRLRQAENFLQGKEYTDELGKELRKIIQDSISPISDIRASKEYRKYIAGVMCDRVISDNLENGGGRS
ncbi:xanthine dehydrogenase family protein subunit M [Petroclostridium sp. X23]|uniref:FAD binding domain-containing protein n=1 Tax=Petroclostridium sp. X23 TaxID=3045146 RepID=UPI0024ADB642|nr:xanthine dehydrogenase family protein subunit M [Petroclostridium sp. X23]WHH60482.1 xanthine dehydrogenase family protein subunit M [Petroclostridium sp. X23]